MSYQVLARKWRPQVFEDVVGQGHITRTLQNAISSGRLAHAFLFSGPRGVGKTTTARILAKALNCAQGPTPNPCGKCDSCLETAAGMSVDVIEIDGASNRGIEHIRELREAVKYAPVGGKYKVYVIDEVHMLTNEAFNALLKTLEEPPPHVIFIFATTEPQKIPATIHSRCQRYGFKRISLHEITERLRKIAGAEKITISNQGLSMIARAAEGSMRDSQSLLDQAVSYSGMEIKDEDLQATLGSVAQEALLKFVSGLLSKDSAALLQQVDVLLEQGQDIRQFLSGIVEHLRNLIVAKISSEPTAVIELPAADIEAIKEQAKGADPEHLLMLFDSLSKTLDDMRWSPHQRFTLEVGVIKACSLAPLKPLTEILGNIKELEARLATGRKPGVSGETTYRVSEKPVVDTASRPAAELPSSATSNTGSPGAPREDVWNSVMTALRSKKPGLASFLEHSTISSLSETDLVISLKGNGFQLDQLEKPESLAVLEQVAEEVLNRKVKVRIQAIAAAPKAGGKTARPKKTETDNRDPAVQDVLKIFPEGEVIE